MDFDAKLERDPNIVSSLLTVFSIVLWIMIAVTALIWSSLFSRSNEYSPYWAEEGNSENIPALK